MTENKNTISYLDNKDLIIKIEKKYYDDLSSNKVAYILDKQDEIREHFGKQSRPNMFALGASLLLDNYELEEAEDWEYVDNIYKNFGKGNVNDTQKLNTEVRNNKSKCICGQNVGLQNLFSLEYNKKKIIVGGCCIKKKCLRIVEEKILEELVKKRKKNTNIFSKVITISNNTWEKYFQGKVKKYFNILRFNAIASRPKLCGCGVEIKGNYKQCYNCLKKNPKCECGRFMTKNKKGEYYKHCYSCNIKRC